MNPHKAIADISTEILQFRREYKDIFKVLNGKNLQSSLPYSARLKFRIEEEIKSFSDRQNLKEYSNIKHILKEILKGLL